MAVVTPTDRPKSVRNRCLIELFCDVVCVGILPFWHFCWCRGFCHRTGSDLLLFVFLLLRYYLNEQWRELDWLRIVREARYIDILSLLKPNFFRLFTSWIPLFADGLHVHALGHLVSPLVCRGPWMSIVVLYCRCHSDGASVLLYSTCDNIDATGLPRGSAVRYYIVV